MGNLLKNINGVKPLDDSMKSALQAYRIEMETKVIPEIKRVIVQRNVYALEVLTGTRVIDASKVNR